MKRFEKCAKDLESETNQHPTLHAVLYRMDTSVVDLAPKPHKVRFLPIARIARN